MYRYRYAAVFLGVILLAIPFFYRTSPRSGVDTVGTFADVSLRIEYALTPSARERGLGFRSFIPKDYGMLFVFPKDDRYGFWMKDTLVPLDMFWLDASGRVVYVAPDVATSTYPGVFYPDTPARYVLETAAGFARAHAVNKGTELLLSFYPSVSK